jgi:Protein of unknown function (DUF3800)
MQCGRGTLGPNRLRPACLNRAAQPKLLRMLVFIDESGDPGFKLESGASPIFVASIVIFETDDAAADTERTIANSEARRLHNKKEFKFNKCSNGMRDRFFSAINGCGFSVRAIVIKKEIIYSPILRADKERFYQFFVNQMLRHDNGVLKDAKVNIDGSGDKTFGKDLAAALKKRGPAGGIKHVKFKNSKNDVLVQLADMCTGAIARSYRPDRPDHNKWRGMLANKIDDVWEFR